MSDSEDSEGEDDEVFDILNRIPPKPRIFRHREEYLFTYDDKQFIRRLRLTKDGFLMFLDKIKHIIAPTTKRSFAINEVTKLIATFRFYATGNFLITAGDFTGLSEPSMSRIVKEVSRAIASLSKESIKFPTNAEDRNATFQEFYDLGPGFSNIIGAIDCTHVKIQGQGGDHGEDFRNRKQYFSINVQTVSGADLKAYDVVARWPGSTHDSYIFNQSSLKTRLEANEFGDGMIVGDGGYAIATYMMTPYRTPTTQIEKLYNNIHAKTRNPVERQYGVIKRRFPCLAFGLKCKMDTILMIIVACFVLHNFCIDQKIEDPPVNDEIISAIEDAEISNATTANDEQTSRNVSNGRTQRNIIANQLYRFFNPQ